MKIQTNAKLNGVIYRNGGTYVFICHKVARSVVVGDLKFVYALGLPMSFVSVRLAIDIHTNSSYMWGWQVKNSSELLFHLICNFLHFCDI